MYSNNFYFFGKKVKESAKIHNISLTKVDKELQEILTQFFFLISYAFKLKLLGKLKKKR